MAVMCHNERLGAIWARIACLLSKAFCELPQATALVYRACQGCRAFAFQDLLHCAILSVLICFGPEQPLLHLASQGRVHDPFYHASNLHAHGLSASASRTSAALRLSTRAPALTAAAWIQMTPSLLDLGSRQSCSISECALLPSGGAPCSFVNYYG